jgi:CHASE3 domain sensor protein
MAFQWIRAVLSTQPDETLRAGLFAAIPLVFLLGTMLFRLAHAMPEAEAARAEAIASLRTVQVARLVTAAIRDAERGQREYLLTGRDSDLAPYDDAKQSLPKLMAELQATTRETPEQQKRLLKLRADVTNKMNELGSTLAAMRQSGVGSARAVVGSDLAASRVDTISSDMAQISDAAQAHLSTRLSRARDADRHEAEALVIGSLLSVVAFIGGAALLQYGFMIAVRSERTLQATLDSIREGVIVSAKASLRSTPWIG